LAIEDFIMQPAYGLSPNLIHKMFKTLLNINTTKEYQK